MTSSNRCTCCRKKLSLSDFACTKCDQRFCSLHRLPEEHKCTHDYKAAGQQQLTTQLIKAVADKVMGDRI